MPDAPENATEHLALRAALLSAGRKRRKAFTDFAKNLKSTAPGPATTPKPGGETLRAANEQWREAQAAFLNILLPETKAAILAKRKARQAQRERLRAAARHAAEQSRIEDLKSAFGRDLFL